MKVSAGTVVTHTRFLEYRQRRVDAAATDIVPTGTPQVVVEAAAVHIPRESAAACPSDFRVT
jgi:hypothetical protein